MSELVTPAVVLRTQVIRESDLVVILLTLERGKVDCIARGARRSRRRFPGGLPVGARGEVGIKAGRGSLAVLSSFAPTRDHSVLGRDLEVFAYVAYLCELSDQLITGTGADTATFGRLIEAIEATIGGADGADGVDGAGGVRGVSAAILRRYELGLLDGLGLLPALERCGVCGSPPQELDDEIAFSVGRGGALCLAHAKAARRLPVPVAELASTLLEGTHEAQVSGYAAASRSTRRDLRDLCRELIQPHLRGPLRSLAFFAQLHTALKGQMGSGR